MDTSFSLLILDKNFVAIHPISKFSAFIWNVGYWDAGEVQLEVPWEAKVYQYLKVGYYLYLRGQEEIMVIETIGLTYDSADRSKRRIVVKGRTLSALLTRRIIWGYWSATNQDFQTFILQQVNSAIGPSAPSERIVPFFKTKTNESASGVKFSGSGYGENLYDLLQAGCETFELGFKTTYDDDEEAAYFQLYKGVDRSYSQTDRPPVVFSSSFENLGPCRYALDTKEYKTIVLATGREENGDRTSMIVGARNLTGLDRYELYVSTSNEQPADIAQSAMEKLAKVNTLQVMDAEFDSSRQFKFGKDFFVGDLVQVVTDFGLDSVARVTGYIMSWDESGFQEVPTFKIKES